MSDEQRTQELRQAVERNCQTRRDHAAAIARERRTTDIIRDRYVGAMAEQNRLQAVADARAEETARWRAIAQQRGKHIRRRDAVAGLWILIFLVMLFPTACYAVEGLVSWIDPLICLAAAFALGTTLSPHRKHTNAPDADAGEEKED